MSEPSCSFQSLHLDEMPITRSQGQPSQTGRGSRGRGRDRLDPLSRPSTPNPRAGPSRPPANPLTLPTGPLRRPQDRLDPHISVECLWNFALGNDSYYAIQLNPVSVRIYTPSGGRGRVTCSCDVFRSTQGPCAHIYVSLSDMVPKLLKLTFTVAFNWLECHSPQYPIIRPSTPSIRNHQSIESFVSVDGNPCKLSLRRAQ